MRLLRTFSVASALVLCAHPALAEPLKLRILETTDVHMNLLSFDYYQDKATEQFGLARAITLIKAARSEAPNSLLFDNGDLLQGNPLGDVMAKIKPLKAGQTLKKTLAMDVKGMKSDDVIAKGKERLAFVDEDGVTFKSPLNGAKHRFSAEISMGIQHKIGADIMFAFDELTTLMNTRGYQERSVERTFRWAKRCVAEHERLTRERLGKPYQALYGVVQGANYEDLRRHAAEEIASLDFDGVGIGGAIEKRIIGDTCAWICDAMPESRPRHVLGIASVDDIFACVENGGDTFDCVAPARCARNGAIYTRAGRYNIKRAQHKFDFGPLEEGCDCYTCQHYSRAYVDHLLRAREFNGFTLATIHNEHFFVKLLDDIRASIDGGYFDEFRDEALAHFYGNGERRPGL